MRRTCPLVLIVVTAALALVAAGCGGGGNKNAAATETTSAATTEATPTEATTTEATTTEAATTDATTTTPLSGLALSKNCRDLAELGQRFSGAFSGATSGAALKKDAQLLKEFADKTPEEIRPDFQVVADAYAKLVDALGDLKAGSTPDPETIAKLQKLSTEFDQAKLTQASQRIAAWVQKNCRS